MNFEKAKKFLFENYSKQGFEQIVVDNDTTWMLKSANTNNAYVCLTNKNETLRLELFNVNATFDINDLYGIAVLENINGESKILSIGNDRELIKKISNEELKKIKKNNRKNFFMTTETSIDMEVEKRIVVISAQRVYGINFIKDLFGFVRDIIGGRIDSLESALDKAHNDILIELKERAIKYGGNAIIGLKIEHTYNNANNGSILSVFATGTVIKYKKKDKGGITSVP